MNNETNNELKELEQMLKLRQELDPDAPTAVVFKNDPYLLPCPFCGYEASMTQHESAGGDGRMIWIVGCNSEDCEVSFQGHARKCDAAKDWNARAIDPQLLKLCENDEEREILATKNADGLFTRFLIHRAKGDSWPKTPCHKCGHRFHEKECRTSLVSSHGSTSCDCAGYDHAAAEMRWKPFEELLRRIDQMLLEAGDEDPFTQNHGDGANLSGLTARDIYVLGRSTLLLNLMGKITKEWDVHHKAKAEPADNLAEVGERE